MQRLNLNFTENWDEELTDKVIGNFNFNKNCNISSKPFLKNSFSTGYLTLLWTMECELEESTINFELFFDEDPTHTHISTFFINSVASPEKVFTSSRREWKETDNESKSESRFDSFRDYLELGFNHILSGYDHLAFLLAILILGFTLKNLIIVITGFTIGHSITLALGALGLVTPSSQFVEALIGYSIVIIAVECIASITHNHSLYGRKIKRNFRGETGTIKWFDPSKGYGFLIRDKGGDLFVHLRAVQNQDRRKLKENTRVRFSVEETEKGPQAENIRII